MSLNSETLIAALRSVVTEHYGKNASPLLLSDLGVILARRSIWPVPGDNRKLRDVIETAHDPDLVIVRDPNSPAYIAVATGSTKEIVERFIEHRVKTSATIPNLEALPRSVLLAFCVRQESGKPVFVQKKPPFRYRLSPPSGDEVDQFLPIDERYRRPGLRIIDLHALSASDRLDLQTRIAAWSKDNDVRLEDFYKISETKHGNALQRFLAAQPHGVVERILIPGDIALILNKHE